MAFLPTKILRFVMSSTTPVANFSGPDDGWLGYPHRWYTFLSIVPQAHGSRETPTPYFYTGQDVAVGDYIVTSGAGRILKIVSISGQTTTSVACIVEDENRENILSDRTTSGDGGIPEGEGLLFVVKNGWPILHPLPDALAAGLPPYFASDVLSRFLNSRSPAPALHASTHHTGGTDPLTPAAIGAAATVHTHTLSQISDIVFPTTPPLDNAIIRYNATASAWSVTTDIGILGVGSTPLGGWSVGSLGAALAEKAGTASPTFTGVVTIPVGSNSAPSLTFANDTNTGVFRHATDVVGIAAGGSTIARVGVEGLTVNHNLLITETTTTFANLGRPLVHVGHRFAQDYATYFHGYHSGSNTGLFLSGYGTAYNVISAGMSLRSASGSYPTATINYKSHSTNAAAIEFQNGNIVFRQTNAGAGGAANVSYAGVANAQFVSENGGSVACVGVDPAPARLNPVTNPPPSQLYLLRDDATIDTGPRLTFSTQYTSGNYAAIGFLQFKRNVGASTASGTTRSHFVIATGDHLSGAFTYVERVFVNGVTGALGVNSRGAAANPALYVGGDTDTGLFQAASSENTLSIATGGAERLRVDASGRVGVGTSAPTTLLDVNADTVRLRSARTPASASASGNTGDICWDANFIYVCTAPNTWRKTSISVDGATAVAQIENGSVTYEKIQNISATNRLLGRSSAGAGVVEEIVCTAFGRSLLDDTDASTGLTTLGAASRTSPSITGAATFANTGDVVPLAITNTGTARSFVVNDENDDATPFVIDANGNVGVGVSTVTGRLHVANSVIGAAPVLTIQGANSGSVESPAENGAISFRNWQFDTAQSNARELCRIHSISRDATTQVGGVSFSCANASGVTTEYFRIDPYQGGVISFLPVLAPVTSGTAGSYVVSFAPSGDPDTGFGQVSGQSNTASIFTNGQEQVRVDAAGRVGIGGGGVSTTSSLVVWRNPAGGVAQTSVSLDGTIQSDVTTTYRGVLSSITTAATTFTLTNIRHYEAAMFSALGAGSVVTNASGFFVNASLGGKATNTYGVYADLASAANTWNIYCNGTAANWFAGRVGIGSGRTVPTSALDVNGVITVAAGSAEAPALTFTDDTRMGMYRAGVNSLAFSTNGAERIRIGPDGEVGIGMTGASTIGLRILHDTNANNIVGTVLNVQLPASALTSYGYWTAPSLLATNTAYTAHIHYIANPISAIPSGSSITAAEVGFQFENTIQQHSVRAFVSSLNSLTGYERYAFFAAGSAPSLFNGSAWFANGAAGTPSIAFSSDTNTGFFQAGAAPDTLSVAANGGEVARFGSTRVNVNRDMLLAGTTGTVSGNAGVIFASGSNHFRLAGNTTNEFTIARVSTLDTAADEDACFRVVSLAAADTRTTVRVGGYTDNNRPQYSFLDDTNTGVANPAVDVLTLVTDGVERLRADASGNVGIGTGTTPLSSRLQVNGAVAVGNGTAEAPALVASSGATTGIWFPSGAAVGLAAAGVDCARLVSTGKFQVWGTQSRRSDQTSDLAFVAQYGLTAWPQLSNLGTSAERSFFNIANVRTNTGDLTNTGTLLLKFHWPSATRIRWKIRGSQFNGLDGAYAVDYQTYRAAGWTGSNESVITQGKPTFAQIRILSDANSATTNNYYLALGTTTTAWASDVLSVDVDCGWSGGNNIDWSQLAWSMVTDETGYSTAFSHSATLEPGRVYGRSLITSFADPALPDFTWMTDLDTGISNPSTNTLAFSTGGFERLRITSAGNLLVGTSTSRSAGPATAPIFQIEGTTAGSTSYQSIAGSTTAGVAPQILLARHRGAVGESTLVNSGDSLGFIRFSGGDGTDCISAAALIECRVDGTAASNVMPGSLIFSTTQSSATPTERLRIKPNGNVGIGTDDPQARLHVVGSVEFDGPIIEGRVVGGNTGTAKGISLTNGTLQDFTLTANCTFTMPTVTAGQSFTLMLRTGTGGFTATFTGVKWPGNTAPVVTVASGRMDLFTFVSDGTNWYGSVAQGYLP